MRLFLYFKKRAVGAYHLRRHRSRSCRYRARNRVASSLVIWTGPREPLSPPWLGHGSCLTPTGAKRRDRASVLAYLLLAQPRMCGSAVAPAGMRFAFDADRPTATP